MSIKDQLTRPVPRNFDDMVATMLKCEQTPGQSVYQHGSSVRDCAGEILSHLEGVYPLCESKWRIPKWLDEYQGQILANLQPGKLDLYALYHDCGKPYCRTIDKKTGAVHFPDHARMSRYIWACVGGNDRIGGWIGDDMVIHTATAEEIEEFCKEQWDEQDAMALLVAALAEVHSNAKMFGGITSDSFKSKWKKVDRRGNQICKFYFGVDAKQLE